jgi:hypothetical protein
MLRVVSVGFLTPLVLTGCEARQLGVSYADKQAASVDTSWVTAAKACWPDLSHGYNNATMKQYLADPLHFRAAFTAYSAMSDAELRAVASKPLMSAPAPDASLLANSQTAVITRYEALSATSNSLASANNTDSAAPPDALCAIHPGQPVGFK